MINLEITIWTILGFFVLLSSILDSWKYRLLTKKVQRYKSSRSISRTFTNCAIFHKICLLLWAGLYLKDFTVTASTFFALFTSCELFYWSYIWYPYKQRGLKNFKRPGLIKYIINSLLPNHIRIRL